MGPPPAVLAKPLTMADSEIRFGAGWADHPSGFGPGEPRRAVERSPPRLAEGQGGGELAFSTHG